MNIERLTILADHLDNVHTAQFSLNTWHTKRYDNSGNPCGYVACAVGHACEIPALAAQGLRLAQVSGTSFLEPVFENLNEFFAVQAFFGLDEVTAEYLFIAENYDAAQRGPKDVAARIREFIAARGAK